MTAYDFISTSFRFFAVRSDGVDAARFFQMGVLVAVVVTFAGSTLCVQSGSLNNSRSRRRRRPKD
jgi:hypothetical protein